MRRAAAARRRHSREARRRDECLLHRGIGWQLVDAQIATRGTEAFAAVVTTATLALEESGRPSRDAHPQALQDLSRRPTPDLSGAISHAMDVLEAVARDLTNDPKASRYPRLCSRWPTVVALTRHPWAVNAAASFALLLHVQRNGDVGSPRVTGSTSASRAARSPGCTVSMAGRPAPDRRRRPAGGPPWANWRRSLRIVLRYKPVADETTASPPYPIATDSAAAHRRRARSFNSEDNAAYFATRVASRSVSRINDHC